ARPTGAGRRQLSRARLALPDRDVVRPPWGHVRPRSGERDRRSGGPVRRDAHALRSAATSHAGPGAVGDAALLGPADCPAREPPAGLAGRPLGRLEARIPASHQEKRMSGRAAGDILDCIVVGAGAAGLAAAGMLRESGRTFVVLEARDRIGGRAHTVRLSGGQAAERGAEDLHGGPGAAGEDLARYGLATRLARGPAPVGVPEVRPREGVAG